MRSCPGSSCFFEHSLGASRDTCRVRDDFEGLDSCTSSGSQHLTNTGAPRKAQEGTPHVFEGAGGEGTHHFVC